MEYLSLFQIQNETKH